MKATAPLKHETPKAAAANSGGKTTRNPLQLLKERENAPLQSRQNPLQLLRKKIDQPPADHPVQLKENKTGLPDKLKAGVESLSGYSMDDVNVHYNSDKPARLQALAYAQGTDIHVGPGQEKHLPHEAWHVVQQKQGRVQATVQLKESMPINNDKELEREANTMGRTAFAAGSEQASSHTKNLGSEAQNFLHTMQKGKSALQFGTQKTIQRLVGFEAELSVPSMPGPAAAVTLVNGPEDKPATVDIEGFLEGGLPYGDSPPLGGTGAHFQLKADHNDLQSAHWRIRKKLEDMGFVLPLLKNTMSNLEYVTPAENELSADSDTTIDEHLDAVAAHASGLFPDVRNQMKPIPAPATASWTGIPEQDFRNWLGKDYPQIESEINSYKSAIEDKFYLQATVGVIPSAIRDLHRNHTPKSSDDIKEVSGAAMYGVDRAVRNVENTNWFKEDDYIKVMLNGKWNLMSKNIPAKPIDYEAFMGVLHIICMYMVGNALNQTSFLSSSSKNAVPFLSKMNNMGDIISKAAPGLHANRPPDHLINLIDKGFKKTVFTDTDFWLKKFTILADMRGTQERGPIINKNTFVKDMLTGAVVRAVSSPRSFAQPDKLPDEVSIASGKQQAAQFEYRYIHTYPGSAGIKAELKKVVDEVRKLNLKHLPDSRRQEIIDKAKNG